MDSQKLERHQRYKEREIKRPKCELENDTFNVICENATAENWQEKSQGSFFIFLQNKNELFFMVSFLSCFKTRMSCFSLDLSIIVITLVYFTVENFSFLYSIILRNSIARAFFFLKLFVEHLDNDKTLTNKRFSLFYIF